MPSSSTTITPCPKIRAWPLTCPWKRKKERDRKKNTKKNRTGLAFVQVSTFGSAVVLPPLNQHVSTRPSKLLHPDSNACSYPTHLMKWCECPSVWRVGALYKGWKKKSIHFVFLFERKTDEKNKVAINGFWPPRGAVDLGL